jgi:hypothetical protein
MTGGEAAAVAVAVVMLGLCVLVAICLRGASPPQRPDILRALAEVLRSAWSWLPTWPARRDGQPSSGTEQGHATNPGHARAGSRREGQQATQAKADRTAARSG